VGCRGILLRKGEPDSTGRGARMRQPENPQEATGVYTRRRGWAWWRPSGSQREAGRSPSKEALLHLLRGRERREYMRAGRDKQDVLVRLAFHHHQSLTRGQPSLDCRHSLLNQPNLPLQALASFLLICGRGVKFPPVVR
jgi:hypothetical protein